MGVTDRPVARPDSAGRDTPAAAFARYVEPEVPILYRVALTLVGQRVDAEDLVQDTLVRAYRTIDRFDGAHPRAWLLTILRNTTVTGCALGSRRCCTTTSGMPVCSTGPATPGARRTWWSTRSSRPSSPRR